MLLLRRSVDKSCKDTNTADESDAQIAGNGIKEVLNFKISRRQPSLKTVDGLRILSSTLASPLQITFRGPCKHNRIRYVSPQYRAWTVGLLSSATQQLIIMQFTGCHQPVQRSYWPKNDTDWLASW